MWLFLTTGLGRWIVLAAVLSGLILWGCEHLINKGRQEAIAEGIQNTQRIKVVRDAVTERVVTKYLTKQAEAKVITETIEKEVYVYPNNTACLDADFRLLHDDAALGRLPAPRLKPDDTVPAPASTTGRSASADSQGRIGYGVDQLLAAHRMR